MPGSSHNFLFPADFSDEDWPYTSSEDEEVQNAVRKKRRRRGKRTGKPRKPRRKPLPPAEPSVDMMPMWSGGLPGPLTYDVKLRVGGWRLVVNDEHRRSFVAHQKQVFPPEMLQRWWDVLMDKLEWNRPERPPKRGRLDAEPSELLLPRSAAWLTAEGCKCSYEYAGLRFMPMPMSDWFLEITRAVCRSIGLQEVPNSCNANLYQTGLQTVSWHSDDEPLFDATNRDALIVSLSLGAARKFELRPKDDPFQETSVLLEDGDLCLMEGLCQKHYRHRVPPEAEVHAPRINLTWRWVVNHEHGCPLCGAREPVNDWSCSLPSYALQ